MPESSSTHSSSLPRVQSYAVFLKGNWSTATFIFNYGIIGLALVIGIGYPGERDAVLDSVNDRILAKAF